MNRLIKTMLILLLLSLIPLSVSFADKILIPRIVEI